METESLSKRASRMMKSRSARIKRSIVKKIRETRIMNKWAKRRRKRKNNT
tara:strand:- start:1372 stop:1521 length:150 start_codon:yes stop_codon:yes gene_type:complete